MKKLYAYKRLDRGSVSRYDSILKKTRTSPASYTEVKHFSDIDTDRLRLSDGMDWVRALEYDIILTADEESA